MRKHIIILLFAVSLILSLSACGAEKSAYDSLSESQRAVVDNVLSNQYNFSDCNGIRFSQYNGKTYFVASNTEYSQNNTGLGAAGYVKETKYFIVDEDSFVRTEYDAYNGQTAYGAVSSWDSNWDTDTKKEKLANAIKSEF